MTIICQGARAAEVLAPSAYQTAEVTTMVQVNTAFAEWFGVRIEQVRCEAPEYQKFVGRKGTVDDAIVDEKGQAHVRTKEDGVWCPVRLVAAL